MYATACGSGAPDIGTVDVELDLIAVRVGDVDALRHDVVRNPADANVGVLEMLFGFP